MRLNRKIQMILATLLLMYSAGAMAVTLPSSSYSSDYEFDADYTSTSISVGVALPSKSFVALGATDCSAYSSDEKECDKCCEAPYSACLEDCGYTTECYQSCAHEVSTCKKAYCPSSLPIDGGEWVLVSLLLFAVSVNYIKNIRKGDA